MRNFYNKILFAILTCFTAFSVYAQKGQEQPPMPTGKSTGTGALRSPIDGDVWILLTVAVILVVFFAIKFRREAVKG